MLLKIRTYSTRRKCCQHLHLGYLCGSGIPAWEARTFYRWLDGWVAAGCWMGLCCTWFRCFSGDDVDGLTIFHNLSWLGNCLCIHNKHTSHEQIWFYIARILPTWMALVIGQCWQVRFFAAPDLHRNWLPGSRAARSSCLVPSFALLSTFQSEEAVWHLQFVAQPLKLCTAENGNVQPTWCWCAIEPRQFDKVMLILLLVFHTFHDVSVYYRQLWCWDSVLRVPQLAWLLILSHDTRISRGLWMLIGIRKTQKDIEGLYILFLFYSSFDHSPSTISLWNVSQTGP